MNMRCDFAEQGKKEVLGHAIKIVKSFDLFVYSVSNISQLSIVKYCRMSKHFQNFVTLPMNNKVERSLIAKTKGLLIIIVRSGVKLRGTIWMPANKNRVLERSGF